MKLTPAEHWANQNFGKFHEHRVLLIRQIQADALRFAASQIEHQSTPAYDKIIEQANQLHPSPNP